MNKLKSLESRIVKMYKNNETGGTIYINFLADKNEQKKREAIDVFMKLAMVSNSDMFLRSKALTMLSFFYNMGCRNNIDEYGSDASIICEYKKNIETVLLGNIEAIISDIENLDNINEEKDKIILDLITSMIFCLNSFKMKQPKILKFFDLFEEKFGIKKEKKLSNKQSYFKDQFKRLRNR